MSAEAQELYGRCLRGELSGNALDEFQNRLRTDIDFNNDFQLYKEMEGFVEERVENMEALLTIRDINRNHSKQKLTVPKAKPKFLNWTSFMVAASFLLLVFFAQGISYSDLYEDPIWLVERGGVQTEISDAVTEYLKGEKELAIQKLDSINSSESNYWIAEIYAKEMVGDSVLKYMSLTNQNNTRRDRINFIKIITLYNMNRKEEAIQMILDLPPDTDPYYIERLSPLK